MVGDRTQHAGLIQTGGYLVNFGVLIKEREVGFSSWQGYYGNAGTTTRTHQLLNHGCLTALMPGSGTCSA